MKHSQNMRAALMSKKIMKAPDEAFMDEKKAFLLNKKAVSMDIKIVFETER